MDVTKLQKVNQLTQTLKQHGIVASTEDALEVASRIAGNYDEDDFSRIISEHDSSIGLNEDNMREKSNLLTKEQVVEILQSFADQLIEEINLINQKLSEHDEFISYLKGSATQENAAAIELDEQKDSDKVLGVGEAEEIYIKQKQKEVQKKISEDKPEPRSGKYNSDDVSIEKFFYYGK